MMFEAMMGILSGNKEISAWNVKAEDKESRELFFIGNRLDMSRSKKITDYTVTVFKDFEDENGKFRGSATVEISPSAKPEEIEKIISEASYAASFVKNKWYPIPQGDGKACTACTAGGTDVEKEIIRAVGEFYGENGSGDASINSSEFFFTKCATRIINSEGVEVKYDTDNLYIEMIVNSQSDGEEIELYDSYEVSGFKPGRISERVAKEMFFAAQRAIARPTPKAGGVPVILSGIAPSELLFYYVDNSDCKTVFEKISNYKLGQRVCGENNSMNLTVSIDPDLDESAYSRPYDDDGLKLEKVTVIENGVLTNYWGNTRYSHYLSRKPTGELTNYSVVPGDMSVEDLRKGEYLEIEKFSDFNMESVTGEFGGEIRLGWYCDGHNRIPVTGGSVTGNILEAQKSMIFSRETCQMNGYTGPKYVKISDVNISGVE